MTNWNKRAGIEKMEAKLRRAYPETSRKLFSSYRWRCLPVLARKPDMMIFCKRTDIIFIPKTSKIYKLNPSTTNTKRKWYICYEHKILKPNAWLSSSVLTLGTESATNQTHSQERRKKQWESWEHQEATVEVDFEETKAAAAFITRNVKREAAIYFSNNHNPTIRRLKAKKKKNPNTNLSMHLYVINILHIYLCITLFLSIL